MTAHSSMGIRHTPTPGREFKSVGFLLCKELNESSTEELRQIICKRGGIIKIINT